MPAIRANDPAQALEVREGRGECSCGFSWVTDLLGTQRFDNLEARPVRGRTEELGALEPPSRS